MPTFNWKDPATQERLFAATIASINKSGGLSCAEIARVFGQGATYHTIKNQMRGPKKLANTLLKEAEGVAGPAASPVRPKGPRAPRTPKAPKDGVKTGRVVKSAGKMNASKKGSPIKQEVDADDIETARGSDSRSFDDMFGTNGAGAGADANENVLKGLDDAGKTSKTGSFFKNPFASVDDERVFDDEV